MNYRKEMEQKVLEYKTILDQNLVKQEAVKNSLVEHYETLITEIPEYGTYQVASEARDKVFQLREENSEIQDLYDSVKHQHQQLSQKFKRTSDNFEQDLQCMKQEYEEKLKKEKKHAKKNTERHGTLDG
jgi:hypothetical protein